MRVTVEVEDAPPAKDGGKSIRSEAHPHHRLVRALREAIARVPDADRFEGQSVSLAMRYERHDSKADALNLINGVADIIQRRGNPGEPWIIDDDANIHEFRYTESIGPRDRYVIEVAPRHE